MKYRARHAEQAGLEAGGEARGPNGRLSLSYTWELHVGGTEFQTKVFGNPLDHVQLSNESRVYSRGKDAANCLATKKFKMLLRQGFAEAESFQKGSQLLA